MAEDELTEFLEHGTVRAYRTMREQIDNLAALTGFVPWWFYGPPLDGLGNIFICALEDAS